ncbi:MAG: ATP-binding cassette domain-containing protein [Betaproteobacteria bacterium]|nr:ATP-binding cassette domain-containing protein [Betaproteobacteria bacterium]
MPLVQIASVSLAFGHRPLLDHADLVIEPGERIGLIGRNGTGKSSLLKLIEGTIVPDEGTLWRTPGLKVASVPQEPEFEAGVTVFEAVAAGLGEVRKLLVDYHAVAHAMADGDNNPALLDEMMHLQEALEAKGGWQVHHRIEGVLSRLGLDADRKVEALSGGLKKRVALGRALVLEPDLILLDEPTNHLDLNAIEWLEETAVAFGGSVLLVTHDRRFLDNVVTRIIELDRGALSSYPGNFTQFQVRKQEELESEAIHSRKFDKVLAQEEIWIRKGVEARRTRNEGRVLRLEALRRERAARRDRMGSVGLGLSEGDRSGKLVAELENVDKRFGNRAVIKNFTTRILRGDKVGLIGPNGSGKSTLLKLIIGELEPDKGIVRRGTKLTVAYFDQLREQLDESATLGNTISQSSDFVEVGGVRKHIISYLGDFLFPPERVNAPVSTLSGGERNRLLLARLFSRTANVLILDEPTNDLDIETLELLEQQLQDYSGTLLLVSHDRVFLDNVVTQTIAFEGDGVWKEYVGGFSDWQRMRTVKAPEGLTARKPATPIATPEPVRTKPKAKMSFKEKHELDEMPARIEKLEAEQRAIIVKLADPTLYRDQAQEVKALQIRFAAIEEALMQALTRWEELTGKAD